MSHVQTVLSLSSERKNIAAYIRFAQPVLLESLIHVWQHTCSWALFYKMWQLVLHPSNMALILWTMFSSLPETWKAATAYINFRKKQPTLLNSQNVTWTKIGNSVNIFHAGNDDVGRFSLTGLNFEHWMIKIYSKWNTDFKSCFRVLPDGDFYYSVLETVTRYRKTANVIA